MRIRAACGLFLVRLGRFIQLLAIMVMKPRDLIDFTKRTYSAPEAEEVWNKKSFVESGLTPYEKKYLEKIPEKKGPLLLLGLGTGREAVPLAKMGFEVTGVDFVQEMVERAKENALKQGIRITGLVQDMRKLNVSADHYQIAWLSAVTYSGIPTRDWRINMLRKIRDALIPGGYLVCEFLWMKPSEYSKIVILIRKLFAVVTLGNFSYEKGDILWGNREYLHSFFSEERIRSEFDEAGLEVTALFIQEDSAKGGAVLRKSL